MTVYSQQSAINVGRGLENVIQSAPKSKKGKKRILDKILSREQCFPPVMNNQSPKSGFIEISLGILFECKNRCVKMVLITAAAAASCCF